MKCAFCGAVFSKEKARTACQSCSMFGGCKGVKCPKCGYEAPAEPEILKRLAKWFGG